MVIEREDSPADLCEDDGNGGEGFEERFGVLTEEEMKGCRGVWCGDGFGVSPVVLHGIDDVETGMG